MPIRFAAFLLLCLGWAPAHAGGPGQLPAHVPKYAPVKERVCADCPMPKPGIPLPRHAVVVGSWGFFSYGNDYQVVDLDSGTLVKAFVPSPAVPKRRAPKARHYTVMLPKSELPRLVELANRIWAERAAIRTRDAADVSWDLWLIDGQQVRHESGAGLPDGLAAEWLRRIDELAGAHGK
ncbi:hypothetical protein ACI48D_17420 [Massilia sp. LXY-6]|uniref:hypothetical protein n=1 Tax=Massilia sp. LXY-6 TaxID=3379823 RepID=UPI003EE02EDB